MRVVAVLAAVLGLLAVPPTAHAWSFEVHRFITDRAIDLLPTEIRSFFARHRAFVVEHAIDPDLWRSAGWLEEPPRHFLDIDAYGRAPFAELPRDFDAAVAKFGKEKVTQNGTVPWRAQEIYDQLEKAFADQKKGTAGYALENVKFFSAVLSHYVADAHVPFHSALNYDGQLTNQHGIHARFEGDLFDRYRQALRFTPAPAAPGDTARDVVFDALVSGYAHVDGILKADLEALGSGHRYDSLYYDRFFAATRPTLESRMSQAMTAVAALITRAWQSGGRPELPLSPRPPVRTKRQPTP